MFICAVEPIEQMEGVTPDEWIHRGRLALRLMQVRLHYLSLSARASLIVRVLVFCNPHYSNRFRD